MIRLLPLIVLFGCSSLEDYPTTTVHPHSPGTDPTKIEDLLPTGWQWRWQKDKFQDVKVRAKIDDVKLSVINPPVWMTAQQYKNEIFLSGVPTEYGKYSFIVKAVSATGYDTEYFVINVEQPLQPNAEG